jgi:hypothetical protein
MAQRAQSRMLRVRARGARLLLLLLLPLRFMVLYPAARAGRFRPEAPRRQARRERGIGEPSGCEAARERGAQRPDSDRAAPVGRERRGGKPGERRGSAKRD